MMEVKGILKKIRQQEKEKKEYFFALEIGRGVVKSAVWLIEGGQIKVVALGSNEEWEEERELLKAVDASLSSAAEEMTAQEATEPNKIIFGLPADWVEREKIVSEKLVILKELSQKLELEPVGFVVTTEAISHYLKTIEGVPPTAILITLAKSEIFLFLLHLGKISPTQVVKRSQSLGDDVIEGLSRFKEEEPFPARILLYDSGEELQEVRQDLVDYPWREEKAKEKEVTFLHLPKVEILSTDFDIKAVALAGGKEVAKAAGIMVDFVEKKKEPVAPVPEAREKEKLFKPIDFGFVKDKDVLGEEGLTPVEDVKEEVKVEPEKPGVERPEGQPPPEMKQPQLAKKFALPQFGFSWLKKFNFSRLTSFFSGLLSKLSSKKQTQLIVVLVSVFLILLGSLLFFLYWRLPKASIVLLVEPKILEEEFEISLDPSLDAAEKEDLSLPAEEIEEAVSGEKTIGTTGTIITGEKATGEVTIYNDTPQERMLPAGSILTSSSEIEFTLDEEVTIASKEGTPLDPPGEATVKATASEFGTESNLAAGTEFSVANYSQSDFIAKNNSAFTGGTSREIQVVAAEDHEELLASLTEELENQVISQIGTKVPVGKKLLTESLKSSVIEESFSKETDEESTEVSLSLKTKFTALVYSEDELRTLIGEVIEDKIPAGFEFKKEESEIDFELQEVTAKGVAVFEARLAANLLPQIDLEEVKKNLVGKYPQFGKAYLDNLSNVVGTEIKITPRLPSRLLTFPRMAKNIEIEIQVK